VSKIKKKAPRLDGSTSSGRIQFCRLTFDRNKFCRQTLVRHDICSAQLGLCYLVDKLLSILSVSIKCLSANLFLIKCLSAKCFSIKWRGTLPRLLDNGSKALDLQIKLPGTNFIKLLAHSAFVMNKLECLPHAGRYA
jgi:hypothetical protein